MKVDWSDVVGSIDRASRSVRSLAVAMPVRDRMGQELADSEAAQERGYFLPDEDERICLVYARYLSVRAMLLEVVEVIQELLDLLDKAGDDERNWMMRLRAFIVGFIAAAMLVRAASFIIDLGAKRPVVRKKLDEAEPRYGIPAKSYTMVYKNLGSARRMQRFRGAMKFYNLYQEDIASLGSDPLVGELLGILDEEMAFLDYSKSGFMKRKLLYGLHSLRRRHVSGYKKVMFQLLKYSGSMVAELRQPFVKASGQGKRVTPEVVAAIKPMLRAGDILITRHDDALSNLFLPGFWPHAALYIGDERERGELEVGLQLSDSRCLNNYHFLEAKKDGVLFRPIEETLSVDAFMVLRPRLERDYRVEALTRALSHEGKLYDFTFDFRRADRLACTEVIYRSYHGVGNEEKPITFELQRHSGRPCISAEDLIEQALESGDFEKVADFGVDADIIRVYSS